VDADLRFGLSHREPNETRRAVRRTWLSLLPILVYILAMYVATDITMNIRFSIVQGLMDQSGTPDWRRPILKYLHDRGWVDNLDSWNRVYAELTGVAYVLHSVGLAVACVLCVLLAHKVVVPRLPKYNSKDYELAYPVCSECGYNLTGNVSGVCPECGTRMEAKKTDSEPQ
jgi:hypothetical protein